MIRATIRTPLLTAVLTLLFLTAASAQGSDDSSKPASEFTETFQQQLRQSLPFEDRRDFEFAARGLVAKPDSLVIRDDSGRAVWSIEDYRFLDGNEALNTVHPSLERQAKLNMNYGLFEVTEGIWQVRGYDLANITYVRGKTGWIVFDPLTVPETARAAHRLVTETLGERPIRAVIYSHSHGDHFGGVRGVITGEQAESGEVVVIAPRGFMEHVVRENMLAGNAMQRRTGYMYGKLIQTGPLGVVDGALGKGLPNGQAGLIAPNRIVENDIETIEIDGVTLVMQNTPDTEAPSEMNTWLPQFKTLWMAENVTASLHNIYTIRGAQTRDAQGWSKYINQVIHSFAKEADVMMASHHWPRWGNAEIIGTLEKQRDLYGYLHDQALRLANQGVTINEIHNELEVPPALAGEWYNRGYHGSYSHNVRAVVNRYIGFFDMNPASLNKLSPAESGRKYVEFMGGADELLRKSREAFERGEYRWVAEVMNHLVFAEPDNREARLLQADTLEQLGYQSENAGWRNAYLSAAAELRHGMSRSIDTVTVGPDVLTAMDAELIFDYLGVRLNGLRAQGQELAINIVLPDVGQKFLLELKNSHLNNIEGVQDDNAGLTLTINRSDLLGLLLKATTLPALLESGAARAEGDLQHFAALVGLMDEFDYWFEIVEP
jgi:alkyl sulfatase BDS1-like metallo-beta-lactamase superfamily hydrolase